MLVLSDCPLLVVGTPRHHGRKGAEGSHLLVLSGHRVLSLKDMYNHASPSVCAHFPFFPRSFPGPKILSILSASKIHSFVLTNITKGKDLQ